MSLYQSLCVSSDPPSIRPVELDLDEYEDSKVQAEMVTCNFDPDYDPDYDAVSYTWGEDAGRVDININGHEYPVTLNLHDAMRQFRINQFKDGMTKRKLWIDAVCIQQTDVKEKSSQLRLMKNIYARARCVLVWLGRPDDSIGLAFDTLERFAAADGTQDGTVAFREINALGTANERRAAIQRFIQRPYFNRVWIIQEVIVAKKATFFCGSFSVSSEKMFSACQRMTGSGFFPYTVSSVGKLTYLGDWRRFFEEMNAYEREEAFDMKIFVDSRDKNATNPRDKVYALRGIANTAIMEGINVDYSLSVEIVYTDLARHLLSAQPGLRVLSAVVLQHRKISHLRLPTWVPDWTKGQRGGGILQKYYRFAASKLFKAGGTGKCRRVTEMEDAKTICLEGIRLGTVKSIISVKSLLFDREKNEFAITEMKLREMAADMTHQEVYPFTGEGMWKAILHTVTADRSPLSTRISEEYRHKYMSKCNEWIPAHPSGARLDNLPAAAWTEVSKTVGQVIEDKIMFVTQNGYLGLGQEGLEVGDVVCILCGAETPFLLREEGQEKETERRFQFLADCYVHGVMDGEFIDKRESERDNVERFLIR